MNTQIDVHEAAEAVGIPVFGIDENTDWDALPPLSALFPQAVEPVHPAVRVERAYNAALQTLTAALVAEHLAGMHEAAGGGTAEQQAHDAVSVPGTLIDALRAIRELNDAAFAHGQAFGEGCRRAEADA